MSEATRRAIRDRWQAKHDARTAALRAARQLRRGVAPAEVKEAPKRKTKVEEPVEEVQEPEADEAAAQDFAAEETVMEIE